MDTLPATLVTGLPGAGKTALLRRWLAGRPAGQRWALLVNRADAGGFRVSLPGGRAPGGGADADAACANGFGADATETVGGCACCSGRLAFETALVRLLRRGPWDRLLIELDGGGDPARFVDLLRTGAAGRHLLLDEVVAVVDARIAQAWLAGAAGPRADLLAAQVAAADRVVLSAWNRLTDPQDCRALAAALRARPPFRRRVECAPDDDLSVPPGEPAPDSAEDWPAFALFAGIPNEWALAHVSCGGVRRIAAPHLGGPSSLTWRWPPGIGFDRAGLERLLGEWRALPGLLRAEGAFRTARDWYLWRHDGSGDAWASTGWRRDNRLEMLLAADPGSAERQAVQVEAGLIGAIRAG